MVLLKNLKTKKLEKIYYDLVTESKKKFVFEPMDKNNKKYYSSDETVMGKKKVSYLE